MTTTASPLDALTEAQILALAELILGGPTVASTMLALSLRIAEKLSDIGYECVIPDNELIVLENSSTRSRAVDLEFWDLSCGGHWFVRLQLVVNTNPVPAGITEVRLLFLDSKRLLSGERDILRAHELFSVTSRPGQFQPESEQTLEGWARHVLDVFERWNANELRNGDDDLSEFVNEVDLQMQL